MARERVFHASPAVRKAVPLLVGIMGPPGSGKTFSALRLATGMREVIGGDIYFLDTENQRALHYADQFEFKHVPFRSPFGSLEYLKAMTYCSRAGAKVIIIDSMSGEHLGEGGYLETAESVVDRIVGPNGTFKDREKAALRGWAYANPLRQKLLEGIKQIGGCLIFCFRAKEKVKPITRPDGKVEIVDMGLMAVGFEDLVYEFTVSILLEARSDGVPTWESTYPGERRMMKLPNQFRTLFAKPAPLSERIGKELAQWAMGSGSLKRSTTASSGSDERAPQPEIAQIRDMPAPTSSEDPAGGLVSSAAQDETPAGALDAWRGVLQEAANEHGTEALQRAWKQVPVAHQPALEAEKDRLKPIAAMTDDRLADVALGDNL